MTYPVSTDDTEAWSMAAFQEAYRCYAEPRAHADFPEGMRTEKELRSMYEQSGKTTLDDFAAFFCVYTEWLMS